MCAEYVCSKCAAPDWGRCGVAGASGLHGARCEFLQHSLHRRRRKCTTCRRIDHVINRLKQLAFQEPWRLNDGPELQEWEKEGITVKA
jgi:hypothetical protein